MNIRLISVLFLLFVAFTVVFAQQRTVINVNTNVNPPIVTASLSNADLEDVLSTLFAATNGRYVLHSSLGVGGTITDLVINQKPFEEAFQMIIDAANANDRDLGLYYNISNNAFMLFSRSGGNTVEIPNQSTPRDRNTAAPTLSRGDLLTFFDMNLPPHGPMIDDMRSRTSSPAAGGGNQPPPTGGLGGLTGGLTGGATRPGTGTSASTAKQVSLASQRFLPYKLAIIELHWTSPAYIIDAITTPGVSDYITLIEAYLPEGSYSTGSSSSGSRSRNNDDDDDYNRRDRLQRDRDRDNTTTRTTTTTL